MTGMRSRLGAQNGCGRKACRARCRARCRFRCRCRFRFRSVLVGVVRACQRCCLPPSPCGGRAWGRPSGWRGARSVKSGALAPIGGGRGRLPGPSVHGRGGSRRRRLLPRARTLGCACAAGALRSEGAMGRGNWMPAGDVGAGCLVYVDACAMGACGDGPCECWDDFRSALRYALGPAWHWCGRSCDCDRQYARAIGGRTWAHDRVVASSALLCLVVDAQGDPWHGGLAVCVDPVIANDDRDRRRGLAAVCAERSAARLWRVLAADGWQLSVRTSAWTSALHPACVLDDVLAT